jgi:hypothetical protein
LLSLVEGIIYSSSIVGMTEKEGEKGLNMSFAACCLMTSEEIFSDLKLLPER